MAEILKESIPLQIFFRQANFAIVEFVKLDLLDISNAVKYGTPDRICSNM